MKTFLVLLFLFFSIQTYSQIKTRGSIEFGYEDRVVTFYDSISTPPSQVYYFKKGLQYTLRLTSEFKRFRVYASDKIILSYYDLNLNEYKLGAVYTLKSFSVGYDHMRSHSLGEKLFSESYDRFFVHMSSSNLHLESSNGVKLNGSIDMGYEERHFKFYDSSKEEIYSITPSRGNLYALLEITCGFKGVSIYTNNKTHFHPDNIFRYNPLLIEYTLGAKYTGENFSWGYEHRCTHSIEKKYFMDGYDKFFLQVRLFGKNKNNF